MRETPNGGGQRGVLFVFSGPAGVGKGTLKARLFEEFGERVAYSVSATTRAPRPGERDGVDYFFITREEFERRLSRGAFLEHACYAGNLYGTPRSNVQSLLSKGVNVLLEIEVQGAMQVKRSMPDCVSVFILPPDAKELERRLRARGTETEEKIRERLDASRRELACADAYDYRIVNDDIDTAYAALKDVFLTVTRGHTTAEAKEENAHVHDQSHDTAAP